jgi:hypothetical protein
MRVRLNTRSRFRFPALGVVIEPGVGELSSADYAKVKDTKAFKQMLEQRSGLEPSRMMLELLDGSGATRDAQAPAPSAEQSEPVKTKTTKKKTSKRRSKRS